jgi:pyrroloquinoline quinone (PQQ) biosynthesis protein C
MKTLTHNELKEIFEVEQKKLEAIRKAFPWENKEAYIAWLVNTYEYALNSCKILATTGGRFPRGKNAFSNRFIAHAAEERGHEKLLENDVKNFGLHMENLKPSVLGQAFHQSLYYWMYADNPVGMFGWVLALEGFAVRNVPAMYEVCNKAFGPKASSFLRVHADEDEGHLQKAFESIRSFTDEENALVAHTLQFYAGLYGSLLQKIQAETLATPLKAAA